MHHQSVTLSSLSAFIAPPSITTHSSLARPRRAHDGHDLSRRHAARDTIKDDPIIDLIRQVTEMQRGRDVVRHQLGRFLFWQSHCAEVFVLVVSSEDPEYYATRTKVTDERRARFTE